MLAKALCRFHQFASRTGPFELRQKGGNLSQVDRARDQSNSALLSSSKDPNLDWRVGNASQDTKNAL